MGKMQRDKGARWEREVANMLKPVYPDAKRGLKQCRDATEEGDTSGVPFWVEAKHHKNVSIQAAMKQAKEATDGRPPIVVSKDNRGDVLVTMLFDDWLAMAEDSRDLQSVCMRVGAAEESAAGMLGECFGDEEAA